MAASEFKDMNIRFHTTRTWREKKIKFTFHTKRHFPQSALCYYYYAYFKEHNE